MEKYIKAISKIQNIVRAYELKKLILIAFRRAQEDSVSSNFCYKGVMMTAIIEKKMLKIQYKHNFPHNPRVLYSVPVSKAKKLLNKLS